MLEPSKKVAMTPLPFDTAPELAEKFAAALDRVMAQVKPTSKKDRHGRTIGKKDADD